MPVPVHVFSRRRIFAIIHVWCEQSFNQNSLLNYIPRPFHSVLPALACSRLHRPPLSPRIPPSSFRAASSRHRRGHEHCPDDPCVILPVAIIPETSIQTSLLLVVKITGRVIGLIAKARLRSPTCRGLSCTDYLPPP